MARMAAPLWHENLPAAFEGGDQAGRQGWGLRQLVFTLMRRELGVASLDFGR